MSKNIDLSNKEIKLLASLPKRCGCHMCKETKKMLKESLGEQRYIELCKSFSIVNY